MTPVRCVVDTNVAVVANHTPASALCAAASAAALRDVMRHGHVFVDDAGDVVAEYRNNLAPYGPPSPGNAFLKWLLTHEWGGQRVTRVKITPNGGETGFHELPVPADGTRYDPSDCKFLAVAAAHPEHPPILQALDSKWRGWIGALEACAVTVHFLCPDEIERLYRRRADR
ncbi:MAG: hypothetical protein IT176_14270 [Acidobacteria bacterium]|nr:hypothetical protein [Acidobacteriota bacterium]